MPDPSLLEFAKERRLPRSDVEMLASIRFRGDPPRTSRRWAQTRYPNLVYWNRLDKGGHFAAFEQPETFVRELRACFRKMVG